MKRTPKKTAQVIFKTVNCLNKVLESSNIMKGYSFFNYDDFKSTGFDDLVKNVCKQNKVSESHIRKVAGWTTKTHQIIK